jgi:peptide/nickel transport system ATP-binding protein
VALTGKSGSGKTSVAMAILDLLPPGIRFTEGMIRWTHGQESLTLPEDRSAWPKLRGSAIGFTQQDVFSAFDPVLTMGRQMLMIIRERSLHHGSGFEMELRMKMEEVGLHDIDRLWHSYPHQLSGGQLQRCQLAMAMVIRPALLITDEPTSAIDKINQFELLDVFAMLRTRYNMAMLCITHEEAVVRYLADRELQLDRITKDFSADRPMQATIATGEASETILEVKNLEYVHAFGGMMYRKGAMVGEINFRLARGSCIGIVGESGSGKSTLAQLLVGLFIPGQGEVMLSGKPIDFYRSDDLTLLRAKIQLVMQDGRGSLHPYFTVQQILEEIIWIKQKQEPGFTCDLPALLEEVELPADVLDRTAAQLSGGECLRISIARALIMRPEVLICDESTSSLDGDTRDSILSLLLRLKTARGLSMLFISHDERIIRVIADEILVLAEGKIVEQGTAQDIIRFPTHPVTKKIFTMHATLAQRGRL